MYMIETGRLGFVPMTKEAIEAVLAGEKQLEKFLGLKMVDGFIEPIHTERVFPIRLEKLKRNPELSKWYGFVTEKETSTLIGMMGFKTAPDENGLVEIGYGIHRLFQGKGYATEMALALKEWAFKQPDVKGITATNILNNNISSIKIVEKLGMTAVNVNENTVDYIIHK
ncbi:GNAT family N-acetyltransferase [Bacillus sp. T33-2]|uniref:GNAT family N-acetyltransferase n=1 Tax=Bacillus sp. T33-2 TaxID=2054168 RepID=UPI000C77BCAE|nr:GNAT family N-acetyltransferase [Bacillus sp. T33-2]PLR95046.1 GNAT family N-acetyltransferase [Bacillus sp. T33-2]